MHRASGWVWEVCTVKSQHDDVRNERQAREFEDGCDDFQKEGHGE